MFCKVPTEILVASVICLVEGGKFLQSQKLNVLAKAAVAVGRCVGWCGVLCEGRHEGWRIQAGDGQVLSGIWQGRCVNNN